ncbi:hypothetical protein D770_12635 [Flammeovirgaceae bacterium 311]|nr:hypothetical protein D770_12635 [Flammeovirgaceae bacterium 311]
MDFPIEYSGLTPCSETRERKLVILRIIMLFRPFNRKLNNTIGSVKKMHKQPRSYTSAKVSLFMLLPRCGTVFEMEQAEQ